jgi:tetratricopeptide (TPR) repeat protein
LLITLSTYSQNIAQIDSILDRIDVMDTSQMSKAVEMVRASKLAGYTKGEARALHKVGYIYFMKDSYALAMDKYQQAIKLRERTGEMGMKAMLLVNIAYIFHELKDFDKEISYANQALKFADTDSINMYANLCLAKGYVGKNDFNKSISLLKTIALYKEKKGDIGTIWQEYFQIGNTFLKISEYDSAIKYYWNADKISSPAQNVLSKMYNQLGVAYHYKKRLNEAETYYKRSLAQNYRPDMGCTYLNLAELTFQKGDKVQAGSYLDSAVKYPHTLEHYAKTMEATGRKDESLRAYKSLVNVIVKDYEQILPYHAEVIDAEYKGFYQDQVETNKLLYLAEKEKSTYFWFIIVSVSIVTLCISYRYGIKIWETYKLKKTDSIISKKYS